MKSVKEKMTKSIEEKVEDYNEFAEIIDKQVEQYQKKSEKLQNKLIKSNNKKLKVDFIMAQRTIDNLMDLKLLLIKELNREIKEEYGAVTDEAI